MSLTSKSTDRDSPPGAAGLPAEVRANRYDVLSRLADDLAHEIKNPLNAIVVNLEVLRIRVANGAGEAARERADVIEHEITRVHALVDQLLQLLRPPKTASGPVAVDGILDTLMSAVQLQAKAARVQFQWQSESSLYGQVRVEPLKFAVLNALTYAIDEAADKAGTVSVETRRAGDEIYIIIDCTATLDAKHDHIKHCRMLMESAGGALESLEPRRDGAGSTLTLVVPTARFAEPKA